MLDLRLVVCGVAASADRGAPPSPGVSRSAVWERTLSGDALAVENALLDGVGRALEGVALKRRLTPSERMRLQKVPTTSGEALSCRSRARGRCSIAGTCRATSTRRSGSSKARSRLDPGFALAHAALGDALWTEDQHDHAPAVAERATAEVLEALRIDPTQAQVLYSLAMNTTTRDSRRGRSNPAGGASACRAG